MGRESSCIANRTLSRQKEGVSGGNTRGGSKSLLSCITLYTQQKSEANMARLAVALALAAGAQAFMAPVTTQPAKTVVYGKGGELGLFVVGLFVSCGVVRSRPSCRGPTNGPSAMGQFEGVPPRARLPGVPHLGSMLRC